MGAFKESWVTHCIELTVFFSSFLVYSQTAWRFGLVFLTSMIWKVDGRIPRGAEPRARVFALVVRRNYLGIQ